MITSHDSLKQRTQRTDYLRTHTFRMSKAKLFDKTQRTAKNSGMTCWKKPQIEWTGKLVTYFGYLTPETRF